MLISFPITVDDIPTDADSVVLRDPTDTYGLRRTDTNAILVASGTAFTHDGTGQYSFTFTEPAAGLDYDYWVEFILGGETYRVQRFSQGNPALPTSSTSGHANYGSIAGMQANMGVAESVYDSNLEQTATTVNTGKMIQCLSFADSVIDSIMRPFGFTIPLTDRTTGDTPMLIAEIANLIAERKLRNPQLGSSWRAGSMKLAEPLLMGAMSQLRNIAYGTMDANLTRAADGQVMRTRSNARLV